MATVSIASPSANQINPLTSAPLSESNYLQRCVEELNPEVVSKYEWIATMYSGLSKTIVVAYPILAVGAFVAVGLLAPIYLPVAAITAILLCFPVLKWFRTVSSWSSDSQFHADQLKGIAQEFNSLPQDTRLIALNLAQMHILWNTVPGVQQLDDLTPLKPLIARCVYWRKQQEGSLIEATRLAGIADQLIGSAATGQAEPNGASQEDLPENPLDIRKEALKYRDWSLFAKAQAAFHHAAILRPQFAGNMDEIAEVSKTKLKHRAIEREFNDPAADHFVLFKNRNLQPILRSELINPAVTVQALSQRFLAAMAA